MRRFKILILTDHRKHSSENSLYALALAMQKHPLCGQLDIATRGNVLNDGFFEEMSSKKLFAKNIDESFCFSENGSAFEQNLKQVEVANYDAIWLRLPPPLSTAFLHFLETKFQEQIIINAPNGILEAGSKAFLMNFLSICPPMKICHSLEDILAFKNQFQVVLKPFREYGGKGIVRINKDKVWIGTNEMSFDEFADSVRDDDIEYLGVKFLKNIGLGDKRIVVVNGKIIGASLRLPAKGSWLCNVAMGGSSNYAEVDEDEIKMIEQINPILSKLGIVMYGVDTLVGDDGKRILSEINTTSIGGIPQMASFTGKPLVEQTIDLILKYIKDDFTNR